jgi:hypothetical protein
MSDQQSTAPTPAEITIMAAGGVALIFSFLDFYSAPSGPLFASLSGISAWGKGLFPVATLMVLFVVVMAAHIALTKFAHIALPPRLLSFTWEQIHVALGFFAALSAVAWLVRSKYPYSFGIGFWFILAACIAALVGAVMLQRERATSPPSA